MRIQKIKMALLTKAAAALLVLGAVASCSSLTAHAAGGNVYSCTITPSYSHPVTGEIEDSGGESSKATGQGMVEGAVYTSGILEVTDGGEYYLTVCMGLMDYTSSHSFTVQKVGASGWSKTSVSVTGNGSDSNGSTSDICIQVPSENCIVRGSMYVTPMGRSVIFYFYPTNYKTGNSTGMKATKVTEASSGTSGTQTSSTTAGTADTGDGSADGSTADSGDSAADADGSTADTGTDGTDMTDSADSSETEAASTDSELSEAQGLSLSTAESVEEELSEETKTLGSTAKWILILTVSLTVSGLIVLAVGAGVVYYFRRNWRRWGGDDYDDEE